MITVTDDAILAFRLARNGLSGPGHATVQDASRAVLGLQSQQINASVMGASQRTAGRPTQAALLAQTLEDHTLVRTWGPRDTVHLYDPADAPIVHAARQLWTQTGRRGVMPTDDELAPIRAWIATQTGPFSRDDVYPLVPDSFRQAMLAQFGPDHAMRYGTGRVLWVLARRGELVLADKVGAIQRYVARERWFPEPWSPPETEDAARQLTERYLRTYGPATPKDVAHFFGTTMGPARRWLAACPTVPVGGLDGLVCHEADADALIDAQAPEPAIRMLPPWDGWLMGHHHKHWTANPVDHPKIWRRSAVVAAVVLRRGRVVATWTQKLTKRRLTVTVTPLTDWDPAWIPEVEAEAGSMVRHLDRQDLRLVVL